MCTILAKLHIDSKVFKKALCELPLNMIHGFITKYRIERKGHVTNIRIIKIILSRVSQPGEDEVMNTKLLYITHNALELFSKATQRTAQFDMGGE